MAVVRQSDFPGRWTAELAGAVRVEQLSGVEPTIFVTVTDDYSERFGHQVAIDLTQSETLELLAELAAAAQSFV